MVRQQANDDQELLNDEVEISLNWIEYQEHQEDSFEHNGPIRVICFYCKERFLSVEKRFLHEKTCTKGSTWRYPCKMCNINFRLKRTLQRHQGRHEEPGGFWCMICTARFTSIADRVQHRNAEHRIYSCQICEAKFRRQSDYVEHIVRFHRAKDEDFDQETTHGVKVEEEEEENEISISQLLQVSQELEDLKSEKENEEFPDVDVCFGRDSPDKSRKLKRKLSPEKIIFPSVDDSANLDDDLNGSQRKSQRLMSKRRDHGKVRSLSCADPLKVDPSDEDSDDFDYFDSLDGCNSPFYESNPDMKNEEEEISAPEDERTAPEEKFGGKQRRYFCKFCNRKFSFPQTYRKHMKLHGPDGKLKVKCTKCNKLFESRVDLANHWIVHRDERSHCRYCDKSYLTELSLQAHIKMHHKKSSIANTERDYEQSKSSKSSIKPDVEDFKEDIADPEEKVKKFTCKFCDRQFNFYQCLHAHQSRHGPDGKLRVKCTRCKKFFADRVELANHWITHRGERWPCKFCGKTYLTKLNLLTHIKINHKDVKDLKKEELSAIAEEEFLAMKDQTKEEPDTNSKTEDNDNREEILVAPEELLENITKQHICKFCGKQFSFRQGLNKHMKLHDQDGKLKVKCSKCGKLLADRVELGEHLMIHRGEKLSCNYCDNAYFTEQGLYKHIKSCHKKTLKKKGLIAKTSRGSKMSKKENNLSAKKAKTKEKPATNFKTESSIEDSDNFDSFDANDSPFDESSVDPSNDRNSSTADKEEISPSNLKFDCSHCPKSFSYVKSYTNHLKSQHDVEQPNNIEEIEREFLFKKGTKKTKRPSCKICNERFCDYHALKKHREHGEHHGPDGKLRVRCTLCKEFFDSKDELVEHKKIHREDRESCSFCEKTYFGKLNLTSHIKKYHKTEYEMMMQEKNRKYSGKGENESDEENEDLPDTSKQFICELCKRQFTCYQTLWNHKRLHGPDGALRVKCQICDQYFADRNKRKEHMKETHRNERVTCAFCKKSYTSKDSIIPHIQIYHLKTKKQGTKKIHLCGKCGKSFISKTAMTDHEKSDCGKSPIYQCDVCKKYYRSAGSLKTHKLSHTNELPFLCKYCGKGFRTKAHMQRHERVHTGEKPYKCSYCSMAFSHGPNLTNHLSIHTGFKRYMCTGCGQRFSCISGLQSHRKAKADTCGLVPNCTKALGPAQKPPVEI